MIDKNSLQYPAYIQECELMRDEMLKKMEALEEKLKLEHFRGKDHPETSALDSEFSLRLKEIQKKYGFL